MSVKITRREEKRNTSLRDFLLAAALPLLLTGVFGYLIGTNQAGDSSRNALQAEEQRARADEAERKLNTLDEWIQSVREIHNEAIDKEQELEKERATAFSQDDNEYSSPIAFWWESVNDEIKKLQKKLRGAKGQQEGEEILEAHQIDGPAELMDDYLQAFYENFRNQMKAFENRGSDNSNFGDRLREREEEFREEKYRLRAEVDRFKERAATLENDKRDLKDQLRSQGKVTCPDLPDNSREREQIKSMASDINTMVQNLDDEKIKGLLGRKDEKKFVEQLKKVKVEVDQLVGEIREQASSVQ